MSLSLVLAYICIMASSLKSYTYLTQRNNMFKYNRLSLETYCAVIEYSKILISSLLSIYGRIRLIWWWRRGNVASGHASKPKDMVDAQDPADASPSPYMCRIDSCLHSWKGSVVIHLSCTEKSEQLSIGLVDSPLSKLTC